jgi:serine/threonine-protein kinase
VRECPSCGRIFDDAAESCPDDDSVLVPMGEADPQIGACIGNYRITRRIGRGGMGSVYVGEHPAIGSTVAIKVLHRRYAGDPAMVERFFNEARAVNLIGHENIVRIFDFGHQDDGTPWFVMELLQGRALSALCGAPRPADELVPLFLQIAAALGAAHEAGIVHRDLKPENVFLVDSARGPLVKVLDFGIAKLTRSPGTVHTNTGAVLGSARYMSPEQASGASGEIGARSDIYSFGVLLFELVCGRVPFEASTYGDLLLAHRTEPPPAPSSLVPGARSLDAVILRCLAKDPRDRFASMAEVAQALASPVAPPPARRSTRWMWFAGAGAALAAFLLIARGQGGPVPAAQDPGLRATSVPPPASAPAAPPELTGRAAESTQVHATEPVPAPIPLAPTVTGPRDAPLQAPPPGRQAVPPTRRPDSKHPSPQSASPTEPGEPRSSIPAEVGDGMIEVEW